MKKGSLHEKNPSNFKTYCDLESGTFEKGFLCTSDRFFLIGGYIYFNKRFSISKKFEELLRQAWYII